MLTNTQVRALKPKNAPYKVREKSTDHELQGFAIQVSTAGTRTWVVSATLNGKRRLFKLGRYPDMSILQAREACRKTRRLVAQGIDPKLHTEAQEHARLATERKKQALGTVNQLLDDYITSMRKTATASTVTKMLEKDVRPVIGHLKAKEVTPVDIADLLKAVRKRGSHSTAAHLRAYLHAAFQRALTIDTDTSIVTSTEFAVSSNPVALVKTIRAGAPKDRALTMDEILRLWTALDSSVAWQTAGAIRLILITGQRVEEILRARWHELNTDTNALEISRDRHKTGAAHTVPLTDLAIEIINNLPKIGSPYLFPHRDRQDEHYRTDSLSQAVTRLCVKHDIKHFTPRDLRRTVKTNLARLGIRKEVADRVQGHAMSDVASIHYDRYSYWKEKQEALEIWEQELLNTLNRKT